CKHKSESNVENKVENKKESKKENGKENEKENEKVLKTFKLTYSFNKDEGLLVVQEKGKRENIESGASIKDGTKIFFKATAKKDFYVAGWSLNSKPINDLNVTYEFEIREDSHVEIKFAKKTKEEIKAEKIVIDNEEYLNNAYSNEKSLILLENGKEEILISKDNFDIAIHIENKKETQVKLLIDNESEEELTGNSGIFEKKEIKVSKDFKTFKIKLFKDGFLEKTYSFKVKQNENLLSSIPENLKIKSLWTSIYNKKTAPPIEASNDGTEYDLYFPEESSGYVFHVWVLAETDDVRFRRVGSDIVNSVRADGSRPLDFDRIPKKNQTLTYVFILSHNGEEFEYKLNAHVK
ncbi:MAG: hypothetical protein ACTTJ3_01635, partial [Treponema sp.]